MYQALIKVFTKYSGYFMLKRCIAAWGKTGFNNHLVFYIAIQITHHLKRISIVIEINKIKLFMLLQGMVSKYVFNSD